MKTIVFVLQMFVFVNLSFAQSTSIIDSFSSSIKKKFFLKEITQSPNNFSDSNAYFSTYNSYDTAAYWIMRAVVSDDEQEILNSVERSVLCVRDTLGKEAFVLPDSILNVITVKLTNGYGQFLGYLNAKLFYMAPYQCLYFLNEETDFYFKMNNLPFRAFSYLNRASLFAEVLNQYDSAIVLIDSAIVLWSKIGDTMQLANNIKYKGLLLGLNRKLIEGEALLKTADHMFEENNFEPGQYSCMLDLTKIYAVNNQCDSLIKYYRICYPYFNSSDKYRLFVLNNNVFLGFACMDSQTLSKLVKENINMFANSNVFAYNRIEFYNIVSEFINQIFTATEIEEFLKGYQKFKASTLEFGYYPDLFVN